MRLAHSFLVYTIIAVATFNSCVLAAPTGPIPPSPPPSRSPSPSASPSRSPSPGPPERIIIISINAGGEQTGKLDTINKPAISDDDHKRNRIKVASSTEGQFVTSFSGDCVLLLCYMIENYECVGEHRIEGPQGPQEPKKKGRFMYSHRLYKFFGFMEVICHEYPEPGSKENPLFVE